MNRIVLDTETTNSLECPLAYDIGWAVINENGDVLKTESFAVEEIFLDTDLMSSAYYIEKLPQYLKEISEGDRKLRKLSSIRYQLYCDCKKYNITEIYAHNARFDDMSLKLTQRYLTGSKYRYFVPYAVTMCDTLKMSRQAFGKDEAYINFCKENNYRTKTNQNRFTAEIIYRFISGNNDFIEEHRGIDDVLIEKEILLECIRRGVTEGILYNK